jgi:hypothetical protein
MEVPKLKNWKKQIEDQLQTVGYGEDDLIKIIHLALDFQEETTKPYIWFSEQIQYLNQIAAEFRGIYITLFKKEPPPRPKKETVNEVILDTPESRKQTIREIAVSLTKPGETVSDETILSELKKRGMRLKADNQTATISTILFGFKAEFEKTEKRGVYRRIISIEQK